MTKRVVLGLVESIIMVGKGKERKVKARIDTGATRSSIDTGLAAKLNLGPIITIKRVRSAAGSNVRPVIHAQIEVGGKKIAGEFTVTHRGHMTYPLLVGQNILKKGKFLVDPLK